MDDPNQPMTVCAPDFAPPTETMMPLSPAKTPSPFHDAPASPIEGRPLRTASVRESTAMAQPKPKPISHSANRSPVISDQAVMSGPLMASVAQLEATAEQLSMTSSIDCAIRELHGELKRSDSRRSATLGIIDSAPRSVPAVSASILSTNSAARHGGYSPAAFVMNPPNPVVGLHRNLSIRSGKSAKQSLAEISESDPVSLDQEAFDEADAAPPIDDQSRESLQLPVDDYHVTEAPLDDDGGHMEDMARRTASVRTTNTFEQARDAFIDFDGVHWEEMPYDLKEPEMEPYVDAPLELDVPPEFEGEPKTPQPRARPAPRDMVRPQSYIDPMSGQQMLYYPAQVPAMLKLPPKLSSRPKAAARNERQSQVLSIMATGEANLSASPRERESGFYDLKGAVTTRESWLPDPIASHRDSFAALSTFEAIEEPEVKAPAELRRPERKSRASKLPPQLRASAFFDKPSESTDVEIKDGSAMATLDSILDAAASAPVGAFTDHLYAGKLGAEVYGNKKRARQSLAMLAPPTEPAQAPKKRSSMMWLSKRSTSYEDDTKRPHSSIGVLTQDRLSSSSDENVIRVPVGDKETAEEDDEDEDERSDGAYEGPPTTLLAELQLRKQEQKTRTRNLAKDFPNGMHATLLDMDTVAEAQRKTRQTKRVNLAWEEQDAHVDQNGSDDEDVPLAIIAALQRGAKNRADLQQPVGLLERRQMEDNEPLSHRRARLQGLEPPRPRPRNSDMSLRQARSVMDASPQPEEPEHPDVEEFEEETLRARRLRLAARDGELPRARPVSGAFSAELLSQFGDLDDKEKPKEADTDKDKGRTTPGGLDGEEETLGQRRRRLQAEREARDREIGAGPGAGLGNRRLSMATVLSAHPQPQLSRRASGDVLMAQQQQQLRAAHEREAKLAAFRSQMPMTLPQVGVDRSGGYFGGVYNDTTGGYGPPLTGMGYGMAPGPMPGMPVMPGMNAAPAQGGSMDRVEQWRYGVRP